MVLGNGNMLVCFDKHARVRDLYYHYVGLENHVGEPCVHRIGVFCDGTFSWLKDSSWKTTIDYKDGTMVSDVVSINEQLGLELRFYDVVHNEVNVLIRKVVARNLFEKPRKVKLFFHQQFKIYNTERKDTGYFDPDHDVVIHYEGRRVFVIGGNYNKNPFSEFSIGNYGIDGKEGTWRDAEDGVLEGNPIEHGPVDSVVGFDLTIESKEEKKLFYWIGCGKSIKEAIGVHKHITRTTPQVLHEESHNFWKYWLNEKSVDLEGQDKKMSLLFDKSLFIMRTHVGNAGDIIASGDSDMLQYGHGTYAFVWPRDAAFISIALCKAGIHLLTKPFFEFCKRVIDEKGFFMQKFRSDRSIGSTWHPRFRSGKKQYPIQEDETALVLVALWKYYLSSSDIEFVQSLYDPLIKRAASFMCKYREEKTGLPKESYDLWERKTGTTTFTSCAVYGGLNAASNFAGLLGKKKEQEQYSNIAEDIKTAILKNLHNPDMDYFYNSISAGKKKGEIIHDDTIDISSFYGPYRFNILDVDNKLLEKAYETVKNRLYCKTKVGGVMRFENDEYHRASFEASSNPWFLTTLWCAQYEIAKAKTSKDLDDAKKKIDWVISNAQNSGIMSEQLRADNGLQVSAAPLTWSHGEYISTVVDYVEKKKVLENRKK